MNPATKKDIRSFRISSSKSWRLTRFIVFLFVVVVMLAAGASSLYFCSRFSDMAGVSMKTVMFADVDPSAQYSGLYLKAVERWVMAVLYFSAVPILTLLYALQRSAANRDARILKSIEEKGIQPADAPL